MIMKLQHLQLPAYAYVQPIYIMSCQLQSMTVLNPLQLVDGQRTIAKNSTLHAKTKGSIPIRSCRLLKLFLLHTLQWQSITPFMQHPKAIVKKSCNLCLLLVFRAWI